MPIETHYVDSGKGAHRFASGIVTSAELVAASRKQAADVEGTQKLKYFLYDASDVTDSHVTLKDVAALVEIQRKTAENSRGALVALVTPRILSFGLARSWHSLAQDMGWKIYICRSRPEAIHWLREQLGNGDANSPILAEFPSLKIED